MANRRNAAAKRRAKARSAFEDDHREQSLRDTVQQFLESGTHFVGMGNDALQKRHWQEAACIYEDAASSIRNMHSTASVARTTPPADVVTLQAQLHLNAAQCYLNLGTFVRAREEAECCCKVMPGHAKALSLRCEADHSMEELDKVMTGFKRYHHGQLNPVGWAVGLVRSMQYEWFVDCYRLRAFDDDSEGCCHGVYHPSEDPGGVVADFLLFCKLAVVRGAVPSMWDWRHCLQRAAMLVMRKLPLDDAKDKWGFENVFGTARGTGHSLRITAELIYETSFVAAGREEWDEKSGTFFFKQSSMEAALGRELDRKIGMWPAPTDLCGKVLNDVGGEKPWRRFRNALDSDDDDGDRQQEEDPSGSEGRELGYDPLSTEGIGPNCGDLCAACDARSEQTQKFKKCARCKVVRYCSEACQRADWKQHKKSCKFA